jgi:hypothetical protein
MKTAPPDDTPPTITIVKFGPHPVAAPCAIEERCMYPAPDDTLARVAPTCATCKHHHEIYGMNLCSQPDMAKSSFDRMHYHPPDNFGCNRHEAVRPDAPRAETVDSPKET